MGRTTNLFSNNAAFKNLVKSRPSPLQEHSTFLISAKLATQNTNLSAVEIKNRILKWANNKIGGVLPDEAYEFKDFEVLQGGYNCSAIAWSDANSDVWSIRIEDPDKSIAGRIWITEVSLVVTASNVPPSLGLRQIVKTKEHLLLAAPAVPRFWSDIVSDFALYIGPYQIRAEPEKIDDPEDIQQLTQLILNPDRTLPVFVVSIPANDDVTKINTEELARRTAGLALVYVISARAAWRLSDVFGDARSAYNGAVRTYMPGFTLNSNPYDHRLVLSDQLLNEQDANRHMGWMQAAAAKENLTRAQETKNKVLPFYTIRNSILQIKQKALESSSASEAEQVEMLKQTIDSMQKEIAEKESMLEYFSSENESAHERERSAQERNYALENRINALESALRSRSALPQPNQNYPRVWGALAAWCDEYLNTRLVLAPKARRQIKKSPAFLDVELVARCLYWLAYDCRDRYLDKAGQGPLRDVQVGNEDGIINARCGGDSFDFDYQGQEYRADWHIKTNGNTHDPQRCLRIYYCWDENMQKMIIAELPAHRVTDAS